MKIIQASAAIRNPFSQFMDLEQLGACLLKNIDWSARISHRSEEAHMDDALDSAAFVKRTVMDRADWSVVEHSFISVDATMDRGITHEWVRHRLMSFTQESTRFVNYTKKRLPSFIYPQVEGEKAVMCHYCLTDNQPGRSSHGAWGHWVAGLSASLEPCAYDFDWLDAIDYAEMKYKALISKGWRPQEARSVFPNGLSSRIITSANLRNWRLFFLSRTTAQAHPQIRQLASKLLQDFQKIVPVIYDDIVPGVQQKDSLAKAR